MGQGQRHESATVAMLYCLDLKGKVQWRDQTRSAGPAPGTAATTAGHQRRFNALNGVAVTPYGGPWIANSGHNVGKVSAAGVITRSRKRDVGTAATTGSATDAQVRARRLAVIGRRRFLITGILTAWWHEGSTAGVIDAGRGTGPEDQRRRRWATTPSLNSLPGWRRPPTASS